MNTKRVTRVDIVKAVRRIPQYDSDGLYINEEAYAKALADELLKETQVEAMNRILEGDL